MYTKYDYHFTECQTRTNLGIIETPKYFSHGDVLFTCTGELVEEIAMLMGYEALRDLPMEYVEVKTPITTTKVKMLSGEKLAIVPILRAGLGMVDGMHKIIPTAKIGHIGLARNEERLKKAAEKIGEGAFSYCKALTTVENSKNITDFGAYSFAYTALHGIDATGAVRIGDHAFMKEKMTPFTVELGADLEALGENPFAFCALPLFEGTVSETFNGETFEKATNTYDISENVKVIDKENGGATEETSAAE